MVAENRIHNHFSVYEFDGKQMGWVGLIRQPHSGRQWTEEGLLAKAADWLWLPLITLALWWGVCMGLFLCWCHAVTGIQIYAFYKRSKNEPAISKSLLFFSFGEKTQILSDPTSSTWWEVYTKVLSVLRPRSFLSSFMFLSAYCSWKCHDFKDSSQHIISSVLSLANIIRRRCYDGLGCHFLSRILLLK